MNEIEIKLFSQYKNLDSSLRELFNSEKGVTTYIELLEEKDSQCYDNAMLKRVNWLFNCIVNDTNESESKQEDVDYLIEFIDRIEKNEDPLKIKSIQLDEKKIAKIEQEKESESLASGIIKYLLLFLFIFLVSVFIITSALKK